MVRNELLIVCVLSVFGINGKTTFSLDIPGLKPFRPFNSQQHSSFFGKLTPKQYSGKRVKTDSIRMVYFHDQTVAVVELEPDKLLLNCELIEVLEPEDALKLLDDFEQTTRPVAISFQEMYTLMKQCQQLEDGQNVHAELNKNLTSHSVSGRGLISSTISLITKGIVPGTKWCGTGDIAHDYYDLGTEAVVDKCCRAHDLCPVKVRSKSDRYNLTNDAPYTKSHCLCDDELFDCLQKADTGISFLLGHIYFNRFEIECIEDTGKGRRFRKARTNF